MSTAADLLATGFAVNLTIHGEPLGYIPASVVQMMEHGEAITTEQGKAILNDDTETEITGIFDDAFVSVQSLGGAVGTIEIAAIVQASDVSGVERGAIIIRDSVQYHVTRVEDPQVDGSQVLILSKHAH